MGYKDHEADIDQYNCCHLDPTALQTRCVMKENLSPADFSFFMSAMSIIIHTTVHAPNC